MDNKKIYPLFDSDSACTDKSSCSDDSGCIIEREVDIIEREVDIIEREVDVDELRQQQRLSSRRVGIKPTPIRSSETTKYLCKSCCGVGTNVVNCILCNNINCTSCIHNDICSICYQSKKQKYKIKKHLLKIHKYSCCKWYCGI